MGRTKRIRRRNVCNCETETKGKGKASKPPHKLCDKACKGQIEVDKPCTPDKAYIRFMQWVKNKGFSIKSLAIKPAIFKDTGRGAIASRPLPLGSLVISVPESILITTETALKSKLGQWIKKYKKEIDPLQCLCLYLTVERQLGDKSDWYPYFNILPKTYNNAAYWTPDELNRLPPWTRISANQHVQSLMLSYKGVKSFVAKLPKQYEQAVCLEQYRWAWSTINTRAVYWSRAVSPFLRETAPDCLALAPVLDLLNHSQHAEIEAGFNAANRCYEIRTFKRYKRYTQVFISYGPHDNGKLLVEYGFLLLVNPHNAVLLSLDDVVNLCEHSGELWFEEIIKWVYSNDLHRQLGCSFDGLSWNLQILLRVLVMGEKQWTLQRKLCLLGNVISSQSEQLKNQLAMKLLKWSISQQDFELLPEPNYHESLAKQLCDQQINILNKCLGDIT